MCLYLYLQLEVRFILILILIRGQSGEYRIDFNEVYTEEAPLRFMGLFHHQPLLVSTKSKSKSKSGLDEVVWQSLITLAQNRVIQLENIYIVRGQSQSLRRSQRLIILNVAQMLRSISMLYFYFFNISVNKTSPQFPIANST